QTHYCTYIRVPRLLTLQNAANHRELALLIAFQWYELWLKVLVTDLRAALESDGETYQAVKLLRRGVELFRLFETHADLVEPALTEEPRVRRPLRDLDVNEGAPSAQWAELTRLAG